MSRWAVHLAVGALACAAYVLPGPLQGARLVLEAIGLSPVLAIGYGVHRYRPAARRAWLLLAAGSLLFWFGDLYTYTYPKLNGSAVPFPSFGDGLYVAVYPVMMAGLLSFVRRRGEGEGAGGLIDGLILTIGLALPSWVALIAPYLHMNDLALKGKLVSVAYPIGDVVLLGAAVRLALDSGRREAAFRLLIASISVLLVTDFVYGLLILDETFHQQLWLDAGWMISYLLWGAAALHPSMARVADPSTSRPLLLTPFRLGLLTCASLVAPILAIIHDARTADYDFVVIEASAIGLFGLVVARMSGLAKRQRTLGEELHRRQGEARFAALVRHATDMITVIGPGGGIVYSSPSVHRIIGDVPVAQAIHAQDRERVRAALAAVSAGEEVPPLECALTDRAGQPRVFEVRLTNLIHEEHVGGILINARDVSERKAIEAELTHQAFHDPVTGLANRALFAERVRDGIARARRSGGGLAVIFVDLDDFKTINDSLGHAVGDEVLIEVARRLDGGVRGTDAAARFGGDEFAVLLEGATSQMAADTAQRILDALAVPVAAAGREVALSASLGLSVALDGDARTAEDLIRDADAAMYAAKRDGKGAYRLFEPAMHAGVLARLELRTDLQHALDAGELELHYQPVVRLADGEVTGLEALMRWRHPERGLISPLEFIPIAEETGLIVAMGRWALHEAADHLRALGGDYRMNVNLSAKQLRDPALVNDVRAAIGDLDPARFVLELTESVLMEDADGAAERLHGLKALGLRLALDDFGTGYSSLGYLSRLPVDILKLDRTFLTEDAPNLIAAVVSLGQALGLDVVAEGIEEMEQWVALQALGCHYGQGFLFSRPLPAAESLAALGSRDGPVGLSPRPS